MSDWDKEQYLRRTAEALERTEKNQRESKGGDWFWAWFLFFSGLSILAWTHVKILGIQYAGEHFTILAFH
jgi:hypothetical protein